MHFFVHLILDLIEILYKIVHQVYFLNVLSVLVINDSVELFLHDHFQALEDKKK